MKGIIPETCSGTPAKLAVLSLLTLFIAGLTVFCLAGSTQVLFTHLYYIPIILAAFWFGRRGVLYALVVALFYLWAVLTFSTPDTPVLLAAAGRALFFVGVSLVIAILTTAIIRQQEKITASEERFRAIWEHIQAGIILVDAETHTIVAANPEAERLTGYTEQEMTGHVCHQFVCPAEKGKCPVSDLGTTLDRTERVLITRDRREIPILKTVTPLTIDKKEYLVENFVDITLVKRP